MWSLTKHPFCRLKSKHELGCVFFYQQQQNSIYFLAVKEIRAIWWLLRPRRRRVRSTNRMKRKPRSPRTNKAQKRNQKKNSQLLMWRRGRATIQKRKKSMQIPTKSPQNNRKNRSSRERKQNRIEASSTHQFCDIFTCSYKMKKNVYRIRIFLVSKIDIWVLKISASFCADNGTQWFAQRNWLNIYNIYI